MSNYPEGMDPDECHKRATQKQKAKAFDLLHQYHIQEKLCSLNEGPYAPAIMSRIMHLDAGCRMTTYLKAVMTDDIMIDGPELYMDYTIWEPEEGE